MIIAEVTFGTVLTASTLTLLVTITTAILGGLVMWPRIANSRIRELIPDDAERIIDDASGKVRDGVVDVALPADEELRFYGLLQRARLLADKQTAVLEALEAARKAYEASSE